MDSIEELTTRVEKCCAKVTIILMDIDHELLKLKATSEKSKRSKVNSKVIDEILIDLQIDHKICSYKISSQEEAGKMAICYSKAIAEKQHKIQSRQKTEDLFAFTLNSGKNCHVSPICPEGQLGGVDLLWRNQLMKFGGVSPEMADAIREKFPTPRYMFDFITDLTNTTSEKEAIASIANIVVRRGPTNLVTERKVGKEISTRIYKFITSLIDDSENIF